MRILEVHESEEEREKTHRAGAAESVYETLKGIPTEYQFLSHGSSREDHDFQKRQRQRAAVQSYGDAHLTNCDDPEYSETDQRGGNYDAGENLSSPMRTATKT